MIHLFINAASASAGGGLTYLRNFTAQLLDREDVCATILLSREGEQVVSSLKLQAVSARLKVLQSPWQGSAVTRYWREQLELAGMIRSSGADVLLSTGNVALRNSPVPQIMLSRNALYTTPEFFADLRRRREYALWITERCKGALAKRSVGWADCTVAPTVAFAKELQAYTGREVVTVHHGFDAKGFFASPNIPETLQSKLASAEGAVRLLFVSNYNYYRNVETLLRALALIRKQIATKPLRLFLTCQLRSELNPGSYCAESACSLVKELEISDEVVQLGTVPYESLHHLYSACDVYVTAAYAESFAHPLVEAMASGLPIVASDLPVHREICGDAAIYAPTFSPAAFAEKVLALIASRHHRQHLVEAGRHRSADFSWAEHVDQITRIAKRLVSRSPLHMARTAAVPS